MISVIQAVSLAAAAAAGANVTGAKAQVIEGTRRPLVVSNSAFGPTGLIVIPTAYTAGQTDLNWGFVFADGFRGPSANFGIVPFVEVGGMFVDRDGADDKVIGNAKVTIIPSNFRNFEVGIGVIDAVDAIGRTWYVVGSVDLIVPPAAEEVANTNFTAFRVHGGVGTGMFNERPFFGAELEFDRRFGLIGEWDTNDFNAALRYAHNPDFNVKVGWQSTRLFLGATYTMRF